MHFLVHQFIYIHQLNHIYIYIYHKSLNQKYVTICFYIRDLLDKSAVGLPTRAIIYIKFIKYYLIRLL